MERTQEEIKERLNFLRDRLEFRHKMFVEWLFVDKTIIQDVRAFALREQEMMEEVKRLKEELII